MTDTETPADTSPPTERFGLKRAGQALRWTSLAVVGRQLFQIASALVLARILGPESYGVVSVATVFTTLTTLLMDQGLSSALVQRPELTKRAPGAVATLNILTALVLGAATWFAAPWIAGFFGDDAAAIVLQALGIALVLKGLAVVPRAMLSRTLRFRPIAIADILGGLLGAAAGITAALMGADAFSIVYQVVLTDAVVWIVMTIASRGPLPNFHAKELGPLLPFSLKVFGTNAIAYLARNTDNILVGKVLGLSSLAYYSMAYRVLVVPVQFIGQTVNRVMFPVFSRLAHDKAQVAANLTGATGLLAFAAVPAMALASAASPQLVRLVLGNEWAPTIPVLSLLAIAGARETVFYITPALIRAMGLAGLGLRYEILSTVVQLTGIIIGLFFGLVGVATGYLIAGFALTPVLLIIQRRISGVSIRAQLGTMLPAVHAALWGAAGYLAIAWFAPIGDLLILVLGIVAFGLLAAGCLAVFHRTWAKRTLRRVTTMLRPGRAS